MDEPETELPDLLQAEWPPEQVEQLFNDLEAGAEVQHVQVRTAAADSKTTLAEALKLLQSSEAKMVQVRYRFEGATWCDTLMPLGELTRIVRSQLPE